MESSVNNFSFEERVRRTITWLRVPLLMVPFAFLVAYIHDLKAFLIGSAVAVFGQLIQTWAGSHLHKDEKLTISGPYSHVRNPMYIGRFFLMLGFVMMIWNAWICAAFVVVYAWYAHTRVLREEKRLKEIFKPRYQEWCDETNRWFPKLKPYSKSENRRASWKQIQFNHEEIHMAALLIILAALYFRISLHPTVFWPFQ